MALRNLRSLVYSGTLHIDEEGVRPITFGRNNFMARRSGTPRPMLSNRKLRRRRVSLVALLAAGCLAASAGPASAYSGTGAASYADQWATSNNSPSFPVFSSDCTNFVSQAAWDGGNYPNRNYGGNGTDSWWYGGGTRSNTGQWTYYYSTSWVNVVAYYNFLIADIPGGIYEGSAPGSSTNYYTPNSVVTGDVLFYNWGQGEGMSHAAMQVGIGTDPNLYPNQVWYGNYIDEHTSNRYHAFWSLKPYNAYWSTTTIYFMHISSSN
jgi:putative amidase-like protein